MNIIESNIFSLELVKNEYKFDEVSKFLNTNPNAKELESKFEIDFYKQCSDSFYTILKTEQCPVFVFFDKDMNFSYWEKINFSDDSNMGLIQTLNNESTLNDVLKLDPDGDYPFLYSGWSEYPKISYHIFRNGSVYVIQYDSSDKVIHIEEYIL